MAAARQPRVQVALGAVALVLIVLLIGWPAWAYQWDWTGLGATFSPAKNPQGLRDYYPSKTLWDWLQLLLVPLALALVGYLLNGAQARREEKRETRREQDSVLDAYLAQIADLLLHEGLNKRPAKSEALPSDEEEDKAANKERSAALDVAQAQTTAALRRLDSERTAIMVRFLSRAHLLQALDLGGANPSGARLIVADLLGNLSEASLSGADLVGADLVGADLSRANLSGANLTGAVGTTRDQLESSLLLEGATMPDGSKYNKEPARAN
jgi:hypothetical protein